DVEDIRAHNPRIIYVRGTGHGERGPDADKGSYDSLAFWARAGVAIGAMRPEYDIVPAPPAPGFGDSIGAMTIAGGIMGALFQPTGAQLHDKGRAYPGIHLPPGWKVLAGALRDHRPARAGERSAVRRPSVT